MIKEEKVLVKLNHKNIDHKISVYYVYINNIPTSEIGSLENSYITKRSINSKKVRLIEKLFKL